MAGLRMPEHLIERARSLVNGHTDAGWSPPPLRNAATVVLLRETGAGIEVYLQRRVRTMAFAAGMYVFPGGAVDPADEELVAELFAMMPLDFSDSDIARSGAAALGYDTLAARFAAVRETLEETGHQLGDPAELRYVAHWVTPEVEDRRYDTRFYAAVLTPEQLLIENSGESDADCWLTPTVALEQYGAGEMAMLPPTVAMLAALADQVARGRSAEDAIYELSVLPIRPLLPAPVADPDSASGVRWTLVDVRTREEVANVDGPPAGSESGGVHTSMPKTVLSTD